MRTRHCLITFVVGLLAFSAPAESLDVTVLQSVKVPAAGDAHRPAPHHRRASLRHDPAPARGTPSLQEVDLTADMDRRAGPSLAQDTAIGAQLERLQDPALMRRLRQPDPAKAVSQRLAADALNRPGENAGPELSADLRSAPWSTDQLLANPTDMNDEYVSLAESPVTGNIYAVFAATDLGGTDRDIHIAVSEDGGLSWIVSEMPASSLDEYHPEVAVDGAGYVHVVWVRDDGWILRSRTSSPDDVSHWAWVKGVGGSEEAFGTPSIAVTGAGDFAKVFIAAGYLTTNWDLYQYEWTIIFMYSVNGGQTVTYDYFYPDGYQDLWPDVAMNSTGTVHMVNGEVDYYTGVTEILVASDALTGAFGDPGLITGYTDNSCGFPQIACQDSDVFIVFQEDFTDGLTVDGDIIYTYSWDTGSSFYGPFGLVADEYESVGPSIFTRDGVVGVLWLDAPAGGDEFDLAARVAGGRGHTAMFSDVQLVSEQPRVEPMFHSCFGLATADRLHAAWIDRRDYPTQGHNVYTSRQLVAPDLGPFTPEGWSDEIVGNILKGSRQTMYLASEDTTYISFAMANNGLAPVTGDFGLELIMSGDELDGDLVLGRWTLSGGMETGTYFPVEDIPVWVEDPGDYTLTVNLDLTDSIAESDEANNSFTRTWTWVPGEARMRLTPHHITKRVVPELRRSQALTLLSQPLTTQTVSLPVVQPRLADALGRAAETELLRVMIVPARRLDPVAMGQALKGASRATRREVILGAARLEMGKFQDEISGQLASLAGQGKAAQVRPLWLGGMLAARLSPAAVQELAANPAVGALFLDDVKSETFGGARVPVGMDGTGMASQAEAPGGDATRADAWHLAAIGAPLAWAQGATGAGIVVGHLDSGVAYDHPDLQHAMWDGGSAYPNHGWDAVDDDNDPYDGDTDYWHGTHTAGLIVGDGSAGTTTGAAPGATLMALRAVPGYLDDMIEAMQFGLDNGAHLFTLSGGWGQASETTRSANRYNAELLLSIDVPWICAAGNGDNYGGHYAVPYDIASPGDCPGAYHCPAGHPTAVVTVGAVNQDLSVWAYSSYGPTQWNQDNLHGDTPFNDYPYPDGLQKPDLAAPGGGVTSTIGYGQYVTYSGTSMATPLVTAAFCLVWSVSPQLLVPQMGELLETTAVDLTASPASPGRDNYSGAGLINVPAALGQTPTAEAEQFWIHNDGDMPLVIESITWDDPWLDIVVPDMVVAPDDSLRGTAFIDPALTVEGYHNCNVVFRSSERYPGRILPVTLIYGEQVSAVDQTPQAATAAALSNHPNPFNPRTVLEFEMPRAGRVCLQIFDLRGRLVRSLVDEGMEAGRQQVMWDGLDEGGQAVASGQYFARLQAAGDQPVSRKLMLVR